jgi:uncharacterized coiled-coil DUF342 family protein
MNRFTEKQLEEADYRLDEIRDAKVEKEQKLRVPTPRTDEEWAAWPYAGPGISVHFGRELERELTAVTEQRDGLRSGIDYASDQLHKVTEQRDRLAEAVNAATILIAAKGRHNTMLAYNGLREALQSLTPKDHE